MMGHTFRRCDFKIKSKERESAKKNSSFWTTFLSILEAGASASFLAQTAV